ncbi:MAG: ubiquinol-cytochrome c reductase iron-sulfur subunit [Chloroflexi bacterium]|nr:ubiquinol-cytochrome c reductase iron-sulfur subunit [Chloroflexota bacterium]
MNEFTIDRRAERHDETAVSRRTFLQYTVGAVTSFVGILTGIPIVGYLTGPLQAKQKQGTWVPLGQVADFANSNEPQLVQFTITQQDGWTESQGGRTCWVVPEGGDQFTVFNGRCTHLGCAYSWQKQGDLEGKFSCPCHNGVYDRSGKVIGGPPPRPLDKLETKIVDGQLNAFYEDFRLGVPDKAPL